MLARLLRKITEDHPSLRDRKRAGSTLTGHVCPNCTLHVYKDAIAFPPSTSDVKTDFKPARSAPAVHTVKISLEQCPQVEVEMNRAYVRYFGIAIWAALGIWFVVGLPWL